MGGKGKEREGIGQGEKDIGFYNPFVRCDECLLTEVAGCFTAAVCDSPID